jgi:uncharacterized protein (UPF0332 family)/predicted nucleotidyltransferase
LEDIHSWRDLLLKSNIGHQIAKIIWFGSTLKGTARQDSDVDLLVITEDGEVIRDRIADILLDFQMTKDSPLEIVTSNIDELYPITDYFLKNVLTYGQEVYSMPEKDLKRAAANHYLSLAQEYSASAKDSIEREHYRLGVDGAYNSAELAVKGLLVLEVNDLPGSHGGIAQKFGELYVKSGAVKREIGRKLNRCLDLRNSARYKFTAKVGKEDAHGVLDLAEDMISLLEKELSSSGNKK